ncbi:MAG: PP2C family protein-serine/threonine phosphatase [Candidatus Krumholzibacteriia bacterium]
MNVMTSGVAQPEGAAGVDRQQALAAPGTGKATILIVDDNPVNRLLFDRLVKRAGHESVVLDDGEAALRFLQCNPDGVDTILLDVMMPGIDGLEVTRRIRRNHRGDYIPIVLVTAKNTQEDIVAGLDAGADDYGVKPVQLAELLARLRSALRIRRMDSELRRAAATMRNDLQAARDLQLEMIPSTPVRLGNAEFLYDYRASHIVAGDIFNYFEIDERTCGFYLADVSGHGVAAAMLAIWVSRTLQPATSVNNLVRRATPGVSGYLPTPPDEVCAALDTLLENNGTDKYLTAVYATLDHGTGELTYCRAGHTCPILARADGGIAELEKGGPAVGISLGLGFSRGTVRMQPGDRLFIYSDGLTESKSPCGEQFGDVRLKAGLAANRRKPMKEQLEAVLETVLQHRGSDVLDDDLTVVGVEFQRPGATG